jgi:ABC-type uncharacterized transport system fused permease/ATPase subunit
MLATTLILWLLCLGISGAYAYVNYRLATYTAEMFNVLGDFAAGNIDAASARSTISGQAPTYVGYLLGSVILLTTVATTGQLLAAAYFQRIMHYASETLLLRNANLVHLNRILAGLERTGSKHRESRVLTVPMFAGEVLPRLIQELFFFLFGSIYNYGLLTNLLTAIPYMVLLVQNAGGIEALNVVIVAEIIFIFLLLCAIVPYVRRWAPVQATEAYWLSNLERVDEQSEQIALVGQPAVYAEHTTLMRALEASVSTQLSASPLYAIYVGVNLMIVLTGSLVGFIIPAAICLLGTPIGQQDPSQIGNLLAISVYASLLQGQLNNLNYVAQRFCEICSLGSSSVPLLTAVTAANCKRSRSILDEAPFRSPLPSDGSATVIVEHLDVFKPYGHSREENDQSETVPESQPLLSPSSPPTPGFNRLVLSARGAKQLISDVNFQLDAKHNLLVSGRSGCGKSTLLKVLAGVESIRGPSSALIDHAVPRVSTPPPLTTIFLPQRMYLPTCSLSTLLQYFTLARMASSTSTVSTSRAVQLSTLGEVGLAYLPSRFGWDIEQDWSQILSGGEQQRLIIAAALLYSGLKVLFLDESTSACDEASEALVYAAIRRHCQVVSVSHRSSARSFHHQLLYIAHGKANLYGIGVPGSGPDES